MIVVFELRDIWLPTDRCAFVMKIPIDVQPLIAVSVESPPLRRCAFQRVAGDDPDLVSPCRKFTGHLQGEDLRTGVVIRKELVDGQQDAHLPSAPGSRSCQRPPRRPRARPHSAHRCRYIAPPAGWFDLPEDEDTLSAIAPRLDDLEMAQVFMPEPM